VLFCYDDLMKEQYRSADTLIDEARKKLDRLSPEDAVQKISLGALLVDIRYLEQRTRDGDIPGAVVVHTNEAEWRCDPESGYNHPSITPGAFLIILCNQGFQSSLLAARLVGMNLNLEGSTDVIGGFEAWKDSGQIVIPYEQGS
jgi:rhodanese-related sulfurtransferase